MARVERSELVALFLRVADTLELSAELADHHAERERSKGLSDQIELRAALQARKAAARARTLAGRL